MVEVFVTPRETELEHEVQLGQRGVTSDKESTPDEWTDASQDDTQLIDVWMGLLLCHAQSVRRHTPCFKGSPRYLAVSPWDWSTSNSRRLGFWSYVWTKAKHLLQTGSSASSP